MSLTLFMTLVLILAVAVSLITEAVKKFLADTKIKYSANALVLTIAIIVGIGGTAIAYIFLGILFSPPNILCMVLMGLAVWVGAMVGYDKVLQMVEQVKHITR